MLIELYKAHGEILSERMQIRQLSTRGNLHLDVDRHTHLDSTRIMSSFAKQAKKVVHKYGVTGCSNYGEATPED